MRKSAGFTLIELVIVIIILGILGAVAAPRLFNLQGDAYGANLNALKNSISSAATMANAKAQISGKGMGSNDNQVPGYQGSDLDRTNPIVFKFGYPIAGENNVLTADPVVPNNDEGILATLDGFEYDRYTLAVSNDVLTITPKSINKVTKDSDGCVVIYTGAKADEVSGSNPKTYENLQPAKVEAFTGGC